MGRPREIKTFKKLAQLTAAKRTDLAGRNPKDVVRETEESLRAFKRLTDEDPDDLPTINAFHGLDPEGF